MRTNSEKDPLLGTTEDLKEEARSKLTWRHATLLPSVLMIMFGTAVYSYVLSEWTQYKIKTDFFPNTTQAKDVSCGTQNKTDPNYVKYHHVQQQAASWSIAYVLAEYVPAFFVQLVLPSYSDSYGRKFLFILSVLGLSIKATTVMLTIQFEESFWYIVGANIVEGFTGASFGLFSAMFSFTADITTANSQRSTAIVLIEALSMVGYIVGSFLSGYFVQTMNLGFFHTSIIATGCTIMGSVLILLLPETLPKNKRTAPKPVLSMIKRMFDFYISKDFKGQRLSYILLILAFFFFSLSSMNRSSMETLYFLGQPFCWGPSKIGVFMLCRHGAQCILGLGSVKLMQRYMSDEVVSIISLISNTVSLVVEAFAVSFIVIIMVPITGMFSFLVIPVLRGMLSTMTSPDKQGAVFASVALIEVVSNILASLSQNELYSFTMSFMNGFVFLLMAFCSLITLFFLLGYRCTKHKVVQYKHIQQDDSSPDC